MADRLDYYFRQRVTEAELDLAFELLEKADRNLAADIGVYGIVGGAEPTQHLPVPNLSIDLTAPSKAYDHLGQRIFFGTNQTVDLAVDHSGIPTEVSSSGNERWLAVFLKFDRLLSEPRTDGNSQQVYFRRDESFKLVVRQAAEALIGTASKVPLVEGELLICDVIRRAGQTQIFNADIDSSRRQVFVFAQGNSVEIISGLWNTLVPAVNTVQASLDAVDAELTNHFTATDRRHGSQDIDYPPHGFIAAANVKGALDEMVDDLSSAAAGEPGAKRIGADAVVGTPNALPAGNVDGQLSQILTWINSHLSASSGAHMASAIAALVHNYITSTSVQAQLQEIVSTLMAQTSGTPGSSRIGADAVSGSPNSLVAGTVDGQLSTILGNINSHVSAATSAHSASAIAVADAGNNLNAANVENALAEIMDAFEDDHYRENETNAGQHRPIHQPNFGSGRVLLWDAVGTGSAGSHFRVHADSDSIWFTVNAFWNGSAWQRDLSGNFAGGFRFSRSAFELFHDDTFTATFTDWASKWTLGFLGSPNSTFLTSGSISEVGRVGMESHNTYNATRNMVLGGATTFRSRFPATPSSITFASSSSYNFTGNPTLWDANQDGFGFFSYQNVPSNSAVYWFGSYTAIA